MLFNDSIRYHNFFGFDRKNVSDSRFYFGLFFQTIDYFLDGFTLLSTHVVAYVSKLK